MEMGPPTVPPNSFHTKGAFGWPARSSKKFAASSALSRCSSYTEPWNWFVPLRTMTFMTLPEFWPLSAPAFAEILTTSIASKGRRVAAVAELPASLMDGRYVDGSVSDAPSMLNPFDRDREPLMVYCAKAKLLF